MSAVENRETIDPNVIRAIGPYDVPLTDWQAIQLFQRSTAHVRRNWHVCRSMEVEIPLMTEFISKVKCWMGHRVWDESSYEWRSTESVRVQPD